MTQSLGINRLIVGVNIVPAGCVSAAVDEMKKNPGTILMVDANARFDRSQLVSVTLTR